METRASYGSSRGKKVWVFVVQDVKDFEECRDGEIECLLHSIEINPIDNKNKIVWSLERTRQGDRLIETFITLSESEGQKLIDLAYDFAKNKGYIDNIIKRYKYKK